MACCGGGGCGNKQSFGLAGPTQPTSRYPPRQSDPANEVDPNEWYHAPSNKMRQFEDYNKFSDGNVQPQPYTYSGANLAAVNFPLGGFGTGDIRIQGDGTLGGWTVVNQFHNGEYSGLHKMPACFFGVSAQTSGSQPQSFVLASPQTYTAANQNLPTDRDAHVSQAQVNRLKTLPGVKSFELVGKYPIADITYDIPGLPVTVSLEAMTPLIPNDPLSSSYPVAQFAFTVNNPSTQSVTVRLLQSQQNFVGWDGNSDCTKPAPNPQWGGNVNTPFSSTQHAGLLMTNPSLALSSPFTGSIVASGILDSGTTVGVIPQATSEQDLWNKFVAGTIVDPSSATPTPPSSTGTSYCGGAVHTFTLAPNQSKTVTFVLSWHFPNRMRDTSCSSGYSDILPDKLGNQYATRFRDARSVSESFCENQNDLVGTTRVYRDTMYSAPIPSCILDSAAGRVAVMRCPTMWWCENGIVMGNEGNSCCPLNCSHVYGYTMLLERLFPSLARDMSYSAFVRTYREGCTMRYVHGGWAIDGALATVIKAYLSVRQSDSKLEWLPSVWPNIKDQMVRIMTTFDTQNDGVIRAAQQNTYDTAMNGANTFIGSYYITALRVTAIMANMMGDPDFSKICSSRAALSAKNYDAICWKEQFGYYIADVNISNCKNSYGPGCFVDQICAAGLSAAAGLGYLMNAEHEHSARLAIMKNNQVTMPPFKDLQGHFAPGDTGITVCSYPNGKLAGGMMYTTLVSTGFTSPVIAGLLLDRDTASAEHIATNIRKRQDGRNRSPWNEPECNILYSRAMAHWNLFDQACGLVYDSTQQYLEYDPRYSPSAFNCFFSCENSWGEYTQNGNAGLTAGTATLKVIRGSLELKTLKVAFKATTATAALGTTPIPCTYNSGAITFTSVVTVPQGSTLTVTLKSTFSTVSLPTQTVRNRKQPCCPQGKCSGREESHPKVAGYLEPSAPILSMESALPYPLWMVISMVFTLLFCGALIGYYAHA